MAVAAAVGSVALALASGVSPSSASQLSPPDLLVGFFLGGIVVVVVDFLGGMFVWDEIGGRFVVVVDYPFFSGGGGG